MDIQDPTLKKQNRETTKVASTISSRLMCGTLTSILIFGIDDNETLSIYKKMYLDSYSRRECVMAWLVNTILQGNKILMLAKDAVSGVLVS